MPDIRTTVTELTTGLGMLGIASIDEALRIRPPQMVSMAPETWELMRRAYEGGALASDFQSAWDNGRAFLEAADALRGRRPLTIEWKGSHRAPGDEVAPIDLRVDHVFLVSCKYLSRITINSSPVRLFERLLQGGHGARETDWFSRVAHDNYQALYDAVRAHFDLRLLPSLIDELRTEDRRELKEALASGWPEAINKMYETFVVTVSLETALRWRQRVHSSQDREGLFWRLLRIGSAPYFVLGASPTAPLRLRVATPWDWRLDFRLLNFDISSQEGGQPRIGWRATIEERHSRAHREVNGHVEVRWSHGRFSGNPEAKVYLDTPHTEIPGYVSLR